MSEAILIAVFVLWFLPIGYLLWILSPAYSRLMDREFYQWRREVRIKRWERGDVPIEGWREESNDRM